MTTWIDRSHLAEQIHLLGRDFVVEVAAMLGRIVPETLAEIDASLADRDDAAVRALCHRLRSAAGTLGLRHLDDAAARAGGCTATERHAAIADLKRSWRRSANELRAALLSSG